MCTFKQEALLIFTHPVWMLDPNIFLWRYTIAFGQLLPLTCESPGRPSEVGDCDTRWQKSSTDKEQGVLGWWHEWGIPGFHGLFYLHASLTRKKHKNYNQTTPFFHCSTSSDLTNHTEQKSSFGKMRHTLAYTHFKTTTQTSVINCLKDINK